MIAMPGAPFVGGVARAGRWALLVLLAACSRDEIPATTGGGAGATPTAAPHACPAGSHTAAEGACEPDAPAPAGSPSGASTAAPVASAGPAPPRCLEVGNPERTLVFDWQREARLDAATASKVRGLTGTAAEVKGLANELEVELRNACSRLAMELGIKGPFPTSDAACQGALDGIRATREKLGPGARVTVRTHAPVCLQSTVLAADCVKRCESREVEVKCAAGPSGGRCAGLCDGACEGRAPGKCGGVCEGACETGFTGTCSGICKGTCNGKDMKAGGECSGKCEGACEGTAKGECKGTCRGGCRLKGAVCDGQCLGTCAAPPRDLFCTGDLATPKLDPACAAYCSSRALRRAACTGGVAGVLVTGAKDFNVATQYTNALERHLPALLRVEEHLKGRKDDFDRARAAVDGGLAALTKAASPSTTPLMTCLNGYGHAASEATTSLAATTRTATRVVQAAQGK
jgi:hypothetical protein